MDAAAFKEFIRAHALFRDSDEQPIILRDADGRRFEDGWLFDMRSVSLRSEWLDAYADLFWERYGARYPFQVGSMETAGIPLVAAIVMKGAARGTPVNGFFIRKSRKKDGLLRLIEGELNEHPVILVDDVMNTGTSAIKQVLVLADIGKAVQSFFVLIAFREPGAYEYITRHGVRIDPLFTLGEFGVAMPADTHIRRNPLPVAWRFRDAKPALQHVLPKSAPALDAERVFFGTDAGVLYALRKDSGALAWSFATGEPARGKGILSSPLVRDGSVCFGAYDGTVYCLDTATGAERWAYREADWIGSSPVADAHALYIGLEHAAPRRGGGLVALDLATGKARWRAEFPALTHATPCIIEPAGLVVIGDNEGVIRAYDTQSGTLAWEARVGSAVKSGIAYDQERNTLWFGSFDGSLRALDARTGTERASIRTDEPIFSTPLIENGRVYIASLDKRLYAIDAVTRKLLWKRATRGRIFASPLLVQGALWIGSNDGTLYELDPTTGDIRSVQQFSERIVNRVAYDGTTRRMFVPTVANELYCLDTAGAGSRVY